MRGFYERWVEPVGRVAVAVICQAEVIAIVHGAMADRRGLQHRIPTVSRLCVLFRPWGIPVRQHKMPLGYLLLTVSLAWLNFHLLAEKPRTLHPMRR